MNVSIKKKLENVATTRGRFTELGADKLRGGYYTPSELARWLCAWSIRSPAERILEPSCGDGSFLEAAAQRLLELGATPISAARSVTGIEVAVAEADLARGRLRKQLGARSKPNVLVSDFFLWAEESGKSIYDVVLGNPPFIRYQAFPEPHRSLAMELMTKHGLTPNRLTNIWVPFVVASVALLKPGGRLAMVLPAEVLQVSYATQLRSFLTDRFKSVDIIACNELFFEKAEQEVVLFLADGARAKPSAENQCRVTMIETESVKALTSGVPKKLLLRGEPKILQRDTEKWLKYFLTQREIDFMRELRSSAVATSLSTHASVDVGVVTGKNEFFVLTDEQLLCFGLQQFARPLVSRSAHLKGSRVDKADWRALAASGDRVHLLHVDKSIQDLPASLAEYIRLGEKSGVHQGYKCSIRPRWYSVPSVWAPHAFMFRQIYDFPRLVLNAANATSTDTIHRVTCKGKDIERVIANTYTWLTAASAEIEGRSYGGGVLELEPTEAERLLMPAKLNGAMPLKECDALTRVGRLEDVLQENARIVLKGHMGLSMAECDVLRNIWVKMRDRRNNRRRRGQATSELLPNAAVA
jgi:adenine-specific DNA-methyltransferase